MKQILLTPTEFLIRFLISILIYIHSSLYKPKNYNHSNPSSPHHSHPFSVNFNQLPPLQFKPATPHLNYKKIISDYHKRLNKELKPIKRRKSSTSPHPSIKCPFCGAPHTYIYDNNHNHGQFKCKICHHTFSISPTQKHLSYKCPHCSHSLSIYKVRSNFIILKCKNKLCPFYLKKLSSLSKEQKILYSVKPYKFKLSYTYRIPNFDINSLKIPHPNPNHLIDLSKIRFSKNILGLALTFCINNGLSTRETASTLHDVFDVKISHQTIHNWLISASFYLKNLTSDSFIHISNSTVADETYIKISGKWGYTIFSYDYKNHRISSILTSAKRDSKASSTLLMDTISKIPSHLLKNILFISDRNPIYSTAVSFIKLAFHNSIDIQHRIVKGIKNEDEESRVYRPVKQMIERLNRTYKRHYRITNGFSDLTYANSFNILFMVFFNYLRPHSSLNNNVPIHLPQLDDCKLMPQKWIKLISLASNGQI